MRPIVLALLINIVVFAGARAGDLRYFDDAPLHAVQMVDENEGWAVGDEGVVWHTIDGGQTWERQPTGTRASLRSVFFFDAFVGWVAGREELPHGGSTGVLLFTRDGGLKWQRVTLNALPGLNCVCFRDPQTGILAGDGTDQHPTGVFRTTDGGKTWQPVGGKRCSSWLAADFQSGPKPNAVLAGAWNRLALLRGDRLAAFDTDILGGRSLRALRFLPPAPSPPSPLPRSGGEGSKNASPLPPQGEGSKNASPLLPQGEGSKNTSPLPPEGERGGGEGGANTEAIAVGQGGLVLASDNKAEVEWAYADLKLPAEVLAAWDFHAVGCAGRHVWVAGRPGSVVLHSADRGATWEIQRTGQPLPINGLFFLDEKRGWAVGELGSILATSDGGRTWRVQRKGGARAAVLFIHARGTGLPVDTVAWLGGEQGYLAAAVRVIAPDPASAAPVRAGEPQRFAAAVRRAGGAGGEALWQFPVPQHRLRCDGPELLKGWDQLHAGRAADEVLRQLVLTLRIWRPDVIITDHPDPRTNGNTADALVAEAVHHAFQQAADPKAFPEQITQLGLEPWAASKLYSRWDGRVGAHVALDLTELCLRLESSPRDFAAAAAGLLTDDAAILPGQRYYRLLDSRLNGAAGHQDLMQGVVLAPGGMARRQLPPVAELPEEVRKAVQTRRNLQALAERFTSPKEGDPANADRLLAQIGPALARMRDDQAAPAAYALANQYARAGQWGLAREVFLMMVERYPTHPLTADACRWIIRHNCSSEARRRHEQGHFLVQSWIGFEASRSGSSAEPPPAMPKADEGRKPAPPSRELTGELTPPARLTGGLTPPARLTGGLTPPARPGRPVKFEAKVPQVEVGVRRMETAVPLLTSGEPPAPSPSEGESGAWLDENTFRLKLRGSDMARRWFQAGLDLEPRLTALGPAFSNDPPIQFCLQSARRHLGDFETPRQWYAAFVARQPDGPWRSAAEAEFWLADRRGPPPKPVIWCRRLETRPFLDGNLEDSCWQAIKPITLRNVVGKTVKEHPDDRLEEEYPTQVWLAYDQEYLYLACRCGHPAGKRVPPVKVRPRDADVRPYDRIGLLLDLDRDYSTYFHLQVDQRGCVCEDCWGDLTWNPRWYVAVQSSEEGWQAEAAIPLAELTGDRITVGRSWACNVVRVLPGRGVQAWSAPADVQPRAEGMGLLIFTQGAPVADARGSDTGR